jgi:hypothetical protein
MKANGRINLLDAPNPMLLYDQNVSRPPKTFHTAMNGTWEDTPLSCAFFSKENQQIVQNGIRAAVYRLSNNKYVIAEQSYTELTIIMRGLFLQEAKNIPGNYTQQIEELNHKVVAYVAPRLYGEAKGYLTYLKDASTLAIPMAAPVSSVAYDKTLELKPFF